MESINENIVILHWADIRSKVAAINPRLVTLIDDFAPSSDFDFVNITYKFGQPIIKNGQIQLPLSNTLSSVSLNDKNVPRAIQERLNYSSIPAAVILNKKAEVFYESVDRVMPTKIFNSGSMFGLWEMFDPAPGEFVKHVWSIIAGARSVFMLPKIANQLSHKQLQREYTIQSHAPNHMLQHHQIFTEIANSQQIKDPWEMNVLFFSKQWQMLDETKDYNGLKLRHFLLQEAWRQSSNCRNNMSFSMAWELFAKAVSKRNLKPKPLIVNTLKHLLAIYDGFYPGYAPAINDESSPTSTLIKAYAEIYKTDVYPTVMEPVHLSKVNRPVYYSLQLPSLLEYAPGVHGKNLIIDLRELKVLMDMLNNSLNEKNNHFLFFHPQTDEGLEIKNSKEIFHIDPHLNIQDYKNKKMAYATSSPFLKGCIQISLSTDRISPLSVDAVF